EQESTFGGVLALYTAYGESHYAHEGQRLGLRNDHWIRIERAATRDRKKYGDIALAQWTSEDVRRFQDEYRNQQRTVRRAWEDVRVGDGLGPLLKGPLTPTAEIAFESY